MRFLKLVAIVAGLLFAIALTVTISPLAGFALALPVTVVSGFALFRPLPRLGLGSRVFAGVIFVFVGLGNLALFQDVAERETYLTALRESDPAAYLDELEETDPRRWLRELEALAPERYRAEIERREREAAEAERRRERERAERAAEKARQEAERAAEEERLAAVQARLREMSERAQRQPPPPPAPKRITGAHVGCITKDALEEFRTAAHNNDLRQIRALTSTICTPIEGMEYSVIDRGWMTSRIRVYGNGGSAVLWVISEALKPAK